VSATPMVNILISEHLTRVSACFIDCFSRNRALIVDIVFATQRLAMHPELNSINRPNRRRRLLLVLVFVPSTCHVKTLIYPHPFMCSIWSSPGLEVIVFIPKSQKTFGAGTTKLFDAAKNRLIDVAVVLQEE